jgi:hypothetical protein
VEKGWLYAQKFTNANTAAEVMKVYQRLM